MGYIEVTDQTYRELLSLAVAWRTNVTGALAKLIYEVVGDPTDEPRSATTRYRPSPPPRR